MRVLDVRHVVPRHRAGRHVRRRVRQLAALAHPRHRLPVHAADRAHRARQRGERVRQGLRARRGGLGCARPVDPRQARHAQLHRARGGLHHRARRRRHRVRGVAVVHLGGHSRAARPDVGQHPVRRPQRRSGGPVVAGVLPGPRHHRDRAVPQHPVRGHHRRHGGGAQGCCEAERLQPRRQPRGRPHGRRPAPLPTRRRPRCSRSASPSSRPPSSPAPTASRRTPMCRRSSRSRTCASSSRATAT